MGTGEHGHSGRHVLYLVEVGRAREAGDATILRPAQVVLTVQETTIR